MRGLFERRKPAAPGARVAVVAIMKNEGPYLLEWLAWHRMIGVNRFIIVDNGSDDGMSALLTALEARGILTRIALPTTPGTAPQLEAYDIIARDHAQAAEWLFFIDADEFIRPENGLGAFLDAIPEDVGAVAVNWAIYGSSERIAPGTGAVMRRFPNRAPQDFSVNHHYKSLVRGAALGRHTKNVHHLPIGLRWRRVDTRFEDLRIQKHEGLSREVLWQGLRIQHYVIKSWSEFWLKKVGRGRAAGGREPRSREFFHAHDRNEIYDPLTAGEHERLLAEIETLRALIADLPAAERDLDLVPGQTRLRPAITGSPRGNIDTAALDARGDLIVRGWALDAAGRALAAPLLRYDGAVLRSALVARSERPDVIRTYPEAALESGFMLRVAAADLPALDKPDAKLQIFAQPDEVEYGSIRKIVSYS